MLQRHNSSCEATCDSAGTLWVDEGSVEAKRRLFLAPGGSGPPKSTQVFFFFFLGGVVVKDLQKAKTNTELGGAEAIGG